MGLPGAIFAGGTILSLIDQDKTEKAYKDAQYQSNLLAQRKYKADLENYDIANRTYKKNLNYLNSLIADPTGHPEYRSAKSNLEKEFKEMRTSLKETLRKRGRTGGIQDKVLKDLQTTFEESLTSLHEDIASKARQQKLMLQEPPKPYLGMGEIEWNRFYSPTQADPIADLTGFGMLAALKYGDRTTDDKTTSTLARSGQSIYPGFGLEDIYDWKDSNW